MLLMTIARLLAVPLPCRFAFMTLDTDNDGYVSVAQVRDQAGMCGGGAAGASTPPDKHAPAACWPANLLACLPVFQVEAYELFSCYAPSLLRAVFALWRYDTYANFLTIDDFVRFVEFSEDRTTREAHEFWFSVLDADRDGRLNWLDCRQAYDAVDKSLAAGGVIAFEDLMCQLRDMVPRQARPEAGFTLQELWESKLGGGVLGLLTNANNMLLQRSTAEWNRGDFPL
jgi:hypothetical protein